MDLKRVSSAILGLPMVIIVLLFGNKLCNESKNSGNNFL